MHHGCGKMCQKLIVKLFEMRDECLGNPINHQRPTFFNVVEKVQHMISLRALESSIITLNPSRWSCGSVNPLYCSKLVRGLKLIGIRTIITSNVNG